VEYIHHSSTKRLLLSASGNGGEDYRLGEGERKGVENGGGGGKNRAEDLKVKRWFSNRMKELKRYDKYENSRSIGGTTPFTVLLP
jgi:hypothetical protein